MTPIGVTLARLVWRRAPWLIVVPLLSGVFGFLAAGTSDPVWMSHSMIRLQTDTGSGPTLPGVESVGAQWAVLGRIATQLKLFHSRSVLVQAGERELFHELQGLSSDAPVALPDGTTGPNPLETVLAEFDGSGATREALIGIPWSAPERLHADAEANPLAADFVGWALGKKGPYGEVALRGTLSVQRVGDSDLVDVKLSAAQRELGPRLLQAVLQTTGEVLATSEQFDSDSRRKFFEQRVRDARAHLDEREAELKTYMTANDIANYTDQTRALALHIEDIRLRLAEASQESARYKERRAGLEETLGGPTFLEQWGERSRDDAALLELRQQVADARARDWLQRAVFREGKAPPATEVQDMNSRVQAYLESRLSGLEPHRQTLVYDWLMEDLEHHGTVAGLKVLRDHLGESEVQMQRYAALGSEIKRREREIAVAEAEYLQLVKGLNAATLLAQQAVGGSPFEVVDVASVPKEPQPRGRGLTAVMITCIALGLVFGVVLVVDQVDRSLVRPSQFEEAYDLPVLGGVPHLVKPDAPFEDPSSVVRALLESLVARVRNVAGAHTLQVVAVQPGVGASTIARLLQSELDAVDRPALAASGAALEPCEGRVTVLVVSSGSVPDLADHRALRDLEDAGTPVIGLVVNHLGYAGAEELLGSVPKSRSGVRSWLKRLLSLRLASEGPWRPA